MSEMIPGQPVQHAIGARRALWLQFVAGDAGRAVGRPALLRARLDLARQPPPQHVHPDRARHRRRLRCSASWRSLFPAALPGGVPQARRQPPVYFEAAAVITALVLLGQVLELRARSQTSGAIRALLGLAPKLARRVRDDGSDEDVPLDTRAGRRSAARPARREGARRRRRRRRAERRRRVDADRRAHARGKARGQPRSAARRSTARARS